MILKNMYLIKMANIMDLKKHLNKIRDILRTVGITDSDSIYHSIAFITLRRLTKTICNQVGIPESYAFQNFGKGLDDEELNNKFYVITGECFVYYLRKKLGYDSFRFNKEIGNFQFRQIFSELEKINLKELYDLCDVVGTIYELHLSTGAKSSRDLGQYFTNRLVIRFMIDLVKPKIQKNGQIETIVDPTMGTGGFLSMAIEYLNKQGKVDWKKNRKRVFGFDIAKQLAEMARLNLLLETGYSFPNLHIRDTLSYDMSDKPMSYDIILANEPMGLKGLKYANFCKRVKELKIRGTKAEPAFLQLFMQALNAGGRCAVIVPDGVLFSGSRQHTKTREYLIENFEVHEIIKMNDKNFFMNTGVSASIIFFSNPEETPKGSLEGGSVKFSEICLNKDQTEVIYKEIREIDYETIAEMGYNLNPNVYQQEDLEEIEGYEYKKLGDVCKFQGGKQLSRSKFVEGKYPVIGGGKIPSGYHNKYNKDENTILCSSSGAHAGYISRYPTKVWASDCFSIHTESVNEDYLFYYLSLVLQQGIYKTQTGTAQPHVYAKNIKNFKIPIPPLKKQKKIVEKMDILNNSVKTSQSLIKQLKQTFNIRMEVFTQGCKEYKKLGDVCEINPDNIKNGEFDKIRYIDLSAVKKGFIQKIEEITMDTAPSRARRKVKPYDILLGTVRPNLQNNGYISKEIYSNNLVVSTGFCVLRCKDDINPKYLFYYLMTIRIKEELSLKATGSSYPAVNTKIIETLKIPIPSLKKQKRIVEKMDSLMQLIKSLEKDIEENQHHMKTIITP